LRNLCVLCVNKNPNHSAIRTPELHRWPEPKTKDLGDSKCTEITHKNNSKTQLLVSWALNKAPSLGQPERLTGCEDLRVDAMHFENIGDGRGLRPPPRRRRDQALVLALVVAELRSRSSGSIIMQRNWGEAIIAGLVATLVMAAVSLWVAPMMGIPAMNPAQMLAGAMGGSMALGWIGHLMIDVIVASTGTGSGTIPA
jgi:hypothetical protein